MLYLNVATACPRIRAKAAELFKQAADKGYPPAQYNLALMHVDGSTPARACRKRRGWMKAASDAGLAEAQYNYGQMLMDGGACPDTKQGATLIGLAAEQGLLEAEVDYATLLYLGQGLPRDLKGAVGWYERGRQCRQCRGQNRLPLLAVGERDARPQQAAMWRALARRQD